MAEWELIEKLENGLGNGSSLKGRKVGKGMGEWVAH